ncbi:MAG: STAS domain-containing protein [Gammaproteobacteria bacterium]|nr:STAS domain-containing protein [Gammaproteobacteria bacterium]
MAEAGRLTAAGPGMYELAGTVGFGDAARLLAEGDRAFAPLRAVEVDLARVTRIDSAGLALLIEWSLAARAAGRQIRYRNVPPAVTSLAGISDVSELLMGSAAG